MRRRAKSDVRLVYSAPLASPVFADDHTAIHAIRRVASWRLVMLAWGILLLYLSGCAHEAVRRTRPTAMGPWVDGTYQAAETLPTPRLFVVEVDIAQGQIAAIRLRRDPAWQAPPDTQVLLRRVIERQSTDVYEPRGDDSQTERLLRAIEDALDKARRSAFQEP